MFLIYKSYESWFILILVIILVGAKVIKNTLVDDKIIADVIL